MQYDKFASPMGDLWLTGERGVLTGLSFCRNAGQDGEPGCFEPAKLWLADYFQGKCRPVDFPMAPAGTDFQKLIWQLLLEIPWGSVTTYGQLASQAAAILGRKTMSAQAVGQAVGRNPIAVIIPCHRVVGKKGALTGYAYGLERKAWLLKHEQKTVEV